MCVCVCMYCLMKHRKNKALLSIISKINLVLEITAGILRKYTNSFTFFELDVIRNLKEEEIQIGEKVETN